MHDLAISKVYGNALQWGSVIHLQHMYSVGNETRRSAVTVYFGSVDGQSITCGVWNAQRGVLHRCKYPFTGLKYVDFGGTRILSPKGIDEHIAAVYDSNAPKASPAGARQCDVYRITVAAEVDGQDMVLAGPIIKPHLLCTGLTESCFVGSLATPLLAELLAIASGISLDDELTYSLACDSLLYATGKSHDTPVFASIAVPADEYAAWMERFRQRSASSSFTVTAISDVVFLVRYSIRSSVQLTVFQVRGEMQLSLVRYPGIESMLFTAHYQDDDLTTDLISLCTGVQGCHPAQNTTNAGAVYNGFEQLCMDSAKSSMLTSCDQAVG